MSKQIPNHQAAVIGTFAKNQFVKWESKLQNVVWRSGPTARYNCHGLTFAARRTCIYESEAIAQILQEDGYVEVSAESVLAGDIILYISSDNDVEHSGIVIEAPNNNLLNVPLVLSKWGAFAELIHRANNCPYTFANAKYYRVRLD